ncbi:MAG: shikimate kinase [Pirellulaceae bacterium]|jgi:shikimate kinase
MQVILIGYRGTGKSTVALLVAESLGLSWIDADDEIESRAGCTIKEIFAQDGEAAFRDLEQQVVADLVERDAIVIAMGGGAILREANRQAMAKAAGGVVWLQASVDSVYKRVTGDSTTGARRPQLSGLSDYAEIEDLMKKRQPLYRECADWEVATDAKTPPQIANEIVSLLVD